MATYNYNTQEWETGQEADRVRLEQLREELAIIEGPKGADYLAFTGSTETTDVVASRIRAEILSFKYNDERRMWEEHYRQLGIRTHNRS